MIPALIFQYFLLIILGIAGLITLICNLKRYCDLTEHDERD